MEEGGWLGRGLQGCAGDGSPTMSSLTQPLGWKPRLPRPQSLLQPANGKACLHLTSFVVGDVKYFQSWKYMLSSADTPISTEKWDGS